VKINSQVKVIQMKKLKLSLMTACMMMLLVPTQMKAVNETTAVTVNATETVESAKTNSNAKTDIVEMAKNKLDNATEVIEIAAANKQLDRLEEIKRMDVSAMTSAEKKELRAEVKAIKEDQKDREKSDYDGYNNGGIYISVGGAILIILLLIILL